MMYFVGSGIASLAGAAYLLRDANVAGDQITIFEEEPELGGALDAHGDAASGYFMAGSRMFEDQYVCTWDLFDAIPSRSDPTISVTRETKRAKVDAPWYNHARLISADGSIRPFHSLGFDSHERIEILALMALPESMLNGKRITDCFDTRFFTTNFWFEWSTLFAFQSWHSAIEFRRYLLRFIHHFSTIDTQQGIYRTRFTQYDSMVVPLVTWLRAHGVVIQNHTTVTGIGFASTGTAITAESLTCTVDGVPKTIAIAGDDRVFVTNGSMTANKAFGSTTAVPAFDRSTSNPAWALWSSLAAGRPEFGDPAVFDGHIEESVWESFTVTQPDGELLELIRDMNGSPTGTGGLMTFVDSNWLITLSIFSQPFFPDQPAGTFVWWGYGLHVDAIGNYVKKRMDACTGAEILEEVLGHLHITDRKAAILAAATVIPCMMPFITSQFLVRKAGDRPAVVPHGSTNLAFIGQYAEQPEDVVFTVEYSIRSAQLAVYSLCGVDKKPIPVYQGAHDPKVLLEGVATLHR